MTTDVIIETARLIIRTLTIADVDMEKVGMKYLGIDEEGGYAFRITKEEYWHICEDNA